MTKVNDAMLKQYGAARDAVHRHHAAAAVRARPGLRPAGLAGVLRSRHGSTSRPTSAASTATPIVIEGDYICLYDADGRITGHFGIQRDVTERRRAVEQRERELEMQVAVRTAELAISEHRIRAILSALPDLVFLIDEDGRYVEILSDDEPAPRTGRRRC